MKKFIVGSAVVMLMLLANFVHATELAQHLQDISVTIKAGFSEGSGVLITRQMKDADGNDISANFVWTAAHVVRGLRSTRSVLGSDGDMRTVVEFRDAQVVKELVEDGRKVGELKMDAKIILYSDAEDGEDLALLMVRKQDFVTSSADFYLEDDQMIDIGESLFHVGSLLGQSGANSMTAGIMSQVGRVLNLGTGDGVVFDQTTCAAFPGSSGGGVFFASGDSKGLYVGMLVRGAGETFNLIVPVRRMRDWANSRDVMWAIDANIDMPSWNDLMRIEPEDEFHDHNHSQHSADETENAFRFWINDITPIVTEK